MMNNNDNNNEIIFIELWLMFLLDYFCSQSFIFVCSLILSGLKIKNYLKINILIINYKMDIESLQVKNKNIMIVMI